jgi:hypothetical protein
MCTGILASVPMPYFSIKPINSLCDKYSLRENISKINLNEGKNLSEEIRRRSLSFLEANWWYGKFVA